MDIFWWNLYGAVNRTTHKDEKFLKHVAALSSSGSDLVDTEKTGIKIVLAPYLLAIKDTPRFFKSGLPFEMTVTYINSLK